ncbi:MAG: hypothetical protein RL758_780 [Pseudomonadota bacterium]|jgi:uncharacterized protein (TIGR00369 family)
MKISPTVVFEPEFIEGMREIFEEKIVFNQVLGLKLKHIDATRCVATMQMKPDLVGHFAYNRLHGGVISTALDTTGGAAVLGAIGAKHMHESIEERIKRFIKLGTIDLRVDYLRQGIGQNFEIRAEVLRAGSRVASTRMELLDDHGQLLATGAAAYIVS